MKPKNKLQGRLVKCLWCPTEYEPRRDGGKAQRFCSPACRRAFDQAAREYVREAVKAGTLTVAEIQNTPRATRALVTARLAYCG